MDWTAFWLFLQQVGQEMGVNDLKNHLWNDGTPMAFTSVAVAHGLQILRKIPWVNQNRDIMLRGISMIVAALATLGFRVTYDIHAGGNISLPSLAHFASAFGQTYLQYVGNSTIWRMQNWERTSLRPRSG